jgi:hypothetical protein
MSLYLINLDWWVAYYQMQALQFVATAALIAGLVAFALDQLFGPAGPAHTIKAVKPKSQNYKDLQEFAVLIVLVLMWTAWWHGKEFKG